VKVPFVDLRAQAAALGEGLREVFASVTSRAAYTLGPELASFEESFAAYLGVSHCVGVSSGTDAVKLALHGAGVRPGDDVLVPVNTFFATAEAVVMLGARPVFVDCLPDTAEVDPDALAAAVTPRTTAVVPVHLYGQPVDVDAVGAVAGRHGLAVVEDACQAHGARWRGRRCGSFGVTAAFSFYPGKNLGALGDGGAVVTDDAAVAERLRRLRNHGQADKYTHAEFGYCDRLHNLQAGFLALKLRHLDEWNAARRAAAARYDALLAGVPGVTPVRVRPEAEAVYHLYVVQVEGRDAVRERLAAEGVETGIHYPVPLHLQPACRGLGYGPGDFPVAEAMAARLLSLPMFPEITPAQQEHVVDALARAVAEVAVA